MDKNVLVEYADMKEEIKDLRRRIEKDRRELERLNKVVVTDSVTCGKKGKKPLGTVTIRGVSVGSIQRKNAALEKNIALLEESEISLLKKQTQVEEYIQQIEKSELRIMFRLYYIDNLPWYKVAMHMNQIFPKRRIKYTEDNCRIRHNRFLGKVL